MNTNAIGNDMEPATLQANINKLESKPRNDLTFAERHALSHLRHVREKELGRIAWKNCKPYQKEYAICCQSTSILVTPTSVKLFSRSFCIPNRFT